jgi:hypothetical protein
MARTALVLSLVLFGFIPAVQAQSRVYVAATAGVDTGERGNVPGGAVPSLGGLFGLRLTDAWSIELEVERGWRTTTAGSGESVLVSFPPTTTPTRAEIELYGIRVRDERKQKAGAGWSALAAWRQRSPGRVTVALLAGVSSRTYTTELVRTTTFVSPLLNLPPTYRLPDGRTSRRMVAAGLTGGLMFLVRVTTHVTVAPELRLTTGLITNDPYTVVRAGVRVMWSF